MNIMSPIQYLKISYSDNTRMPDNNAMSQHRCDRGLDDRGSILGTGWDFFLSPLYPNSPCSSPSLISSGYQRIFPWRCSGRGMKLTIRLHVVTRLRMHGVITQLQHARGNTDYQKKHSSIRWGSEASSESFCFFQRRFQGIQMEQC
jgi:hypothetical protein